MEIHARVFGMKCHNVSNLTFKRLGKNLYAEIKQMRQNANNWQI